MSTFAGLLLIVGTMAFVAWMIILEDRRVQSEKK